jgi:hypothetical protein
MLDLPVLMQGGAELLEAELGVSCSSTAALRHRPGDSAALPAYSGRWLRRTPGALQSHSHTVTRGSASSAPSACAQVTGRLHQQRLLRAFQRMVLGMGVAPSGMQVGLSCAHRAPALRAGCQQGSSGGDARNACSPPPARRAHPANPWLCMRTCANHRTHRTPRPGQARLGPGQARPDPVQTLTSPCPHLPAPRPLRSPTTPRRASASPSPVVA